MNQRQTTLIRVLLLALMILIVLNLAMFAWLARPLLAERGVRLPGSGGLAAAESTIQTPTDSPTASATATRVTDTPVPILLPESISPEQGLRDQGVLLLSMRDGANIHLFAYHPLYLPLTRITRTPWDDAAPAISPDGTQLAYSSRQNGYWDIYILNLVSGKQERITDTPDYESSPTWSPDEQWLAYERYNGISLDIYIQSLVDPTSQPIQLTDDPGVDRSPAWSPQGREIAFVSSRTGDEEIWLARLDNVDNRFSNISRSPLSRDRAPVWTHDGARLAWATEEGGSRQFAVWDPSTPDQTAKRTGEGDLATWSPDGTTLFSLVRDPQSRGLAAYIADTGRLTMPYAPLPGSIYGMAWVEGPVVGWLASQIEYADTTAAAELWQPVITREVSPVGRAGIVEVADISAPQPMLHDAVDEAFIALRARVAAETGWDTLGSLENAYVPLTTPPTPSLPQDWLYTGRAFAINPLLVSSGWMAIAREEFNGQVYWRVYLRARYQDGSMGSPLPELIWDLNARYNGDPQAYEDGGALGKIPPGYWIDLTELAGQYGWERLPAWVNWRTFFPSIRFNQFVMTGGMDWWQAMGEMYPVEALRTPTSNPTPTNAPTETSGFPRSRPTGTSTPTLTPVPTLRPTWTPLVP